MMKRKLKKYLKLKKVIDSHQKVINDYLVKINNLSLTERQHKVINNLFHTVSNIERVGDHADNLAELAVEKVNNDIFLSEEAYDELKEICNIAIEFFECAIRARETESDYIKEG